MAFKVSAGKDAEFYDHNLPFRYNFKSFVISLFIKVG